MYIDTGFEFWIRAPRFVALVKDSNRPSTWNVITFYHKISNKAYTLDISIYDVLERSLREVILGVNYAFIPKIVMSKTLLRLIAANATIKTVVASSVVACSNASSYRD